MTESENNRHLVSRIAPTKPPSRNHRAENLLAAEYLPALHRFLFSLRATGLTFFLADRIERELADFLAADPASDEGEHKALSRLLKGCQEILLEADDAYALVRPRIGTKHVVHIHPAQQRLDEISRLQYLEVKDAYIQGHEEAGKSGLVLDFSPYFANFPKVREPSEMGKGISFLNRHLSAHMYQHPMTFRQALLHFLRDCQIAGQSILVNEYLSSPDLLVDELDAARDALAEHPDETPFHDVAHELLTHGFEAGWGATVGTIAANLARLSRVIESPDAARFETFLGRLPLVRTVLMVSPHGWFAQDNVLGRPDTGGQVTYVLDQTRAMERQLRQLFADCGIEAMPSVVILTRLIPHAEGTTCNVPREKVHGTEDCWIVRVPFRDDNGEIIPAWISRFKLWPYLERFAEEARHVVVTELMSRPDLIIGHYSDGNLVAQRLSDDLDTTHCAAVHALEKTKYLLSDMHWSDMDPDYHFSLQFTADLIAYNSADYIISSSYREIGGTPTDMGMFESYETFTMPGLYRVVSGMDPRLARHNIVPPGASEEYFFHYTDRDRRVPAVAEKLQDLLQGEPPEGCVGELDHPDRPAVFALARMDKIKNLSGLAEIFGKHPNLRDVANLFIVSSLTDASQSTDQEEIDEVIRLHELIDQYRLEGHIRWCGARFDKVETGEIYRMVADGRGVFAQPALMETFGLTVVESMACGLPVVVTCFGGPAEIVIPGQSGEVHSPNDHGAFGDALYRILTDSELWQNYSQGGAQRVVDAFSWSAHAEKICQMANVYSYWNYLDVMNRQALDRYIHTLYHTLYRTRVEEMKRGIAECTSK